MEANKPDQKIPAIVFILLALAIMLVVVTDFLAFTAGWAVGLRSLSSLPLLIHLPLFGFFVRKRITGLAFYLCFGILDLAGIVLSVLAMSLDQDVFLFGLVQIFCYLGVYSLSIFILRLSFLRSGSGRPEKDKA